MVMMQRYDWDEKRFSSFSQSSDLAASHFEFHLTNCILLTYLSGWWTLSFALIITQYTPVPKIRSMVHQSTSQEQVICGDFLWSEICCQSPIPARAIFRKFHSHAPFTVESVYPPSLPRLNPAPSSDDIPPSSPVSPAKPSEHSRKTNRGGRSSRRQEQDKLNKTIQANIFLSKGSRSPMNITPIICITVTTNYRQYLWFSISPFSYPSFQYSLLFLPSTSPHNLLHPVLLSHLPGLHHPTTSSIALLSPQQPHRP